MDISGWFDAHKGRLTYSMTGSRNGADGTADCSGSISQALKDNGFQIQGLPSTVTLGSQLARVGWVRISVNQDWNAQKDDIVLISWSYDMAGSGGAGGHVGVMKDPNTFISVDFTTGGQQGTAVYESNWDYYYSRINPSYIEVWRYMGDSQKVDRGAPAVAKNKKAYYLANEVSFVNGIYQIKCDYLVPIGFDWTENGIPVSLVNWVDENGNNVVDGKDSEFRKGMYFSFEIDENNIQDTGEGGYYGGYYYRKFIFGQYGTVWLSTWSKDDLVNEYQ